MNKETKDLKQEMKLQAEQMKHTSTETEKLESNISGLQKEYDIAERKTRATSEALEKAKSIWGETSDEVAKMEGTLRRNQIAQQQTANKILETKSALGKLKSADTNIKVSATADTSGIDKMKSELKTLGSAAKSAGKEIASGLATGAAGAGAGMGAIAIGTREFNTDLARLNTNAQMTGRDLGVVEESFRQVAAISGETDSAVETVSNLLATGFNDEQLSSVIDNINGAAIKFSDTLKTEGIADGIQETFATGAATGQFGELLERSGVSLDSFNQKLAGAKTEADKANLMLETMSSLGLTQVTEKYKEANKEVVDANEANIKMQVALADLGKAIMPLVTGVTEFITKLSEWAAKNPELAQTFTVLATAIGIVMGIAALISPIITALGIASGGASIGVGALMATLLPIIAVIAAVILVIVAVVLVVKNWGSITDWIGEKWTAFWEWFKGLLTGIGDFFKEWGPKILSFITNPIGTMYKFFKNTWNNLDSETKAKFASIFEKIMTPINKARDGVKAAIDKIKSFFNFDFKWPKLKTPKFSIKGSINPLDWFGEGIPKINIAWNALGGVFTKPTVLNTSAGLQGFGEAGNEAILPLNERVLGAIGRAIFASTGTTGTGSPTIYNYEKMLDGAVFHVREEADIKRVARELYNIQQVDKRGR